MAIKNRIFILLTFLCLSNSASSQALQISMYNDGRLLAYIEKRNDIYRNAADQRADRLQFENISGQQITVHYAFRAIGMDVNGNIFRDEVRYRTETLYPGQKRTESGYSNARGYYVDSFVIMNISVRSGSTSQNVTPPPQNGSVPSWAQGTWGGSGGTRITSTQFIQPENGVILNSVRSSASSVDFEGTVLLQNNPVFIRAVVQRTSSSDTIKVDLFLDFGGTATSTTQYSDRYRGN
jgi:hypothetical protein